MPQRPRKCGGTRQPVSLDRTTHASLESDFTGPFLSFSSTCALSDTFFLIPTRLAGWAFIAIAANRGFQTVAHATDLRNAFRRYRLTGVMKGSLEGVGSVWSAWTWGGV